MVSIDIKTRRNSNSFTIKIYSVVQKRWGINGDTRVMHGMYDIKMKKQCVHYF